ncbi:MAG: hypothetical protein GY810_28720 [Aureispira sp.]|nr:hypothetical protein [Aureispira sp.]
MKKILFIALLLGVGGCFLKNNEEVEPNSNDVTIISDNKTNVPFRVEIEDSNTIRDSRDGEVYSIVKIGDQVWMAENLRYNVLGSMLNPDNPSKTYGRLYDWGTLMNGDSSSSSNPSGVQGLCPNGWHLPSDAEWNVLEMAHGMEPHLRKAIALRGRHGKGMKSMRGWNTGFDNRGEGVVVLGFNAFPAGQYSPSRYTNSGRAEGTFYNLGACAFFWSSTDIPQDPELSLIGGGNTARRRTFCEGYPGVSRSSTGQEEGYSCRCIKD